MKRLLSKLVFQNISFTPVSIQVLTKNCLIHAIDTDPCPRGDGRLEGNFALNWKPKFAVSIKHTQKFLAVNFSSSEIK